MNSLIPSTARGLATGQGGAAADPAPTVRPVYDIVENKDAYGLTVYLPGVAKDGLEITAETDQLRISGRRAWKQPEAWTVLYRESSDLPYELVLEHENAIDVNKIHAELRDGVLRASLPKAEALKPRKISVN
jgi:HSP20 family molecular chaperone IbpA